MALTNEQKAVRRAFRKRYGKYTEEIVKRTIKGQSTQQIADAMSALTKSSVATTVGNFTRGTYAQYMDAYL